MPSSLILNTKVPQITHIYFKNKAFKKGMKEQIKILRWHKN